MNDLIKKLKTANVFYWLLTTAAFFAWQWSYTILDLLFPYWDYRWYKIAFTLACYIGFLRLMIIVNSNKK